MKPIKKIMFNDQYGLTEAVLTGVKTMTRRPVLKMCKAIQELRMKDGICEARYGQVWFPHKGPYYNVGEIVAVAQSYKDAGYSREWVSHWIPCNPNEYHKKHPCFEKLYPGYTNKMFVYGAYMPHQIEITDIRVERLQDISDEDCLREGIQELAPCSECGSPLYCFSDPNDGWWSYSPRDAFEGLINKISPKVTHIPSWEQRPVWEANPWVFVYSFKLIK